MNIHVGLNISLCQLHAHICFRQVRIIVPSFFNATSGMNRRPIEGRHLVSIFELKCFFFANMFLYGDSETVSVRPSVRTPRKEITHVFESFQEIKFKIM